MIAHFLLQTSFVWNLWYACLPFAYATLIGWPRSKVSYLLFDRGAIFAIPVAHLVGTAIIGPISMLFGSNFFWDLVGTTGVFVELQVAAAFCITATAADLAFASIFFRKYTELPLVAKLAFGFAILMIGWLLGVVFYLALRRYHRVDTTEVQLGPLTIR